MKNKGTLYLLPNTLGGENPLHVLPSENMEIMETIKYFVVENLKVARRFLKKVGYSHDFSEVTFFELNKHTSTGDIHSFIEPLKKGERLGLLSDAGCPGIADPGANIVSLCHTNNISVRPLVGPSSILLTLISSGFNGQVFTFHGYLPRERKDRIKSILHFEQNNLKTGATHLFMDTPFRNNHVLEDLIKNLKPETLLCIGSNLTMANERIRTMPIKAWKTKKLDFHKQPVMFAIGSFQ